MVQKREHASKKFDLSAVRERGECAYACTYTRVHTTSVLLGGKNVARRTLDGGPGRPRPSDESRVALSRAATQRLDPARQIPKRAAS